MSSREHRRKLRDDERALTSSDLISGDVLERLTGAAGDQNIARDLLELRTALMDVWFQIEGRCAVTRESISEATRLAAELSSPPLEARNTENTGLMELRDRAFTFCVNGYAQLRRAVTYLRPKEVDRLVPPLYPRKGRAKPSE